MGSDGTQTTLRRLGAFRRGNPIHDPQALHRAGHRPGRDTGHPDASPRSWRRIPGATNGRIAFGQRAADGSSNIFSVMPDGTGLKQLTHGAHNHLCASYSADGQNIAYCSDVSGSWEIWSMKQNGTKQHQVTHLNGFSTFPDYSPDGSKIAFVSQLATDSSDQVYVVNAANGGGLTQLTSCPVVDGFCFNDYPVWSPDGKKIAFIHGERFDADGNPLDEQVWVMDANGSNKQQLTTDAPFKDQVPDWSPDGTKIAYASGLERHLGDERERVEPAPADRLRAGRSGAVRDR